MSSKRKIEIFSAGCAACDGTVGVLQDNGFIKTVPIGAQEFGYVVLVHPTTVVEQLRKAGKITDARWLTAYKDIQVESKELTFEQKTKAKAAAKKVIPIRAANAKQP